MAASPGASGPTDRAARLADEAGLGPWERTVRVNRNADLDPLVNAIIGLVVAVGLGVGAWGMARAEVPAPLWLVTLALCAFLVGHGVLFAAEAVARRRRGPALVHLFRDGLVLERTASAAWPVPYGHRWLDHVEWKAPHEPSSATLVALHVPLSDGEFARLVGRTDPDRRDLADLAARCGLPSTPRRVEPPDGEPAW
ncbi:hypothetical protein [Streptomyces radicis]|uniref:Uncharacterized protein n=1 Tax=Streptomyces radicis TaxID=1750517 RepID=A0A3A9WA81_9ACTN|nr:hypothetical protein [Streptomyces radicis]RKN06284.1 hypothetical protein D7319_22565 [Streptomyces radicis]RKN18614.1 hypothetical protein D7318_21425 [Streptomyces radicis]